MKNELNFLHLDMDAFYASVEELDNPKLKGKPMVVGGRSQKGIITTANYEARKYGLHSAMPIFQAKALCPNVIIVPIRHDRYEEMSDKVFRQLEKFSPKIEQMSIDEGCMDISHLDIKPEVLAKLIQDDVYVKTKLTLSIGISYNKFLAKLASDWNKPKGLKIITKDMIPDLLLPLPVRKISGVGVKTEKRMKDMGLHTVEDLMNVPKRLLEYHFGKAGRIMYDRIRGIDDREIETDRERKSIGIERTYDNYIRDKRELLKKIQEYSLILSKDLKDRNILGRTISIKVRYDDFSTVSRSFTFPEATNNLREIYKKTIYLVKQVPLDREIRLFGISMSNLQSDNIRQLDLFYDRLY